MRALIASPLGFLVGVALGALGGGGSILAVPVLVFLVGLSPSSATSTSLVIVGTASVVGAYEHWRSGNVRVAIGVVFGLVGFGGSLVGTTLNRHLDGDLLLLAFAGLTLVAAWRIVAGCPSCAEVGDFPGVAGAGTGVRTRIRPVTLTPARVARIAVAGTGVGFLTGLLGVGGGFIIVPVLALALELPMPAAVGTSLLVIALNSAAALAPRLGGGIEWGTTVIFTIAAIAGVLAGKRIADHLDAKSMQRWFAVLLVAVALYTGTRALLAL